MPLGNSRPGRVALFVRILAYFFTLKAYDVSILISEQNHRQRKLWGANKTKVLNHVLSSNDADDRPILKTAEPTL